MKFLDKWGRDTAKERYGSLHEPALSQKSEEAPQCECDKRVEPEYSNNVPVDSWLVGGGKSGAEGKPDFDHSKSGGK